MLAVIMPVLVLMLAFLVNISLLVHQKIRLQNATDAGTYSAAASLARDLNYIAELNDNIDRIWHGDRASLADPDLFVQRWDISIDEYAQNSISNGLQGAQAEINKYQNDYASILGEIESVSGSAYVRATVLGDVAARLTYYNGDSLLAQQNPASLNFEPAFDAAYGPMLDYAEGSTRIELGYGINSGSCNAWTDACSAYNTLVSDINVPIRKLNHIAYVGRASASPGFSPLAPDRLALEPWLIKSTAAAQPYGGSIEGLANTYGAALIPIGSLANDGNVYYH